MKSLNSIIILPAIFLLIISCAEETTGPVIIINKGIKLIGFSPDSGYVNNTLTLYFSNMPLSTKRFFKVWLNNKQISNYTAYKDSVKIKIPKMDTGLVNVIVDIDTLTLKASKHFYIKPSNSMKFFSFTPDSGFAGDTVTFYGKNLLSDSLLYIRFNYINSQILFICDNYIMVRVPQIFSASKVPVVAAFKNKGFGFGKNFFVKKTIQYPSFNNINISLRSFQVMYHDKNKWSFNNKEKGYDTNYALSDYSFSYTNNTPMEVIDLGGKEFSLNGNGNPSAELDYKVNEPTKTIEYLKFSSRYFIRPYTGFFESSFFELKLENVKYTMPGESIINMTLTGKSLESFVKSIKYYYEYSFLNVAESRSKVREITKLLDFTDSSQVIISIYRK